MIIRNLVKRKFQSKIYSSNDLGIGEVPGHFVTNISRNLFFGVPLSITLHGPTFQGLLIMTPSSANLSNLFFCLAFNKIINCILVYDVLGCLTLAAGSIWLTNTTCQNVMLSTSDERLMFISIDEIFSI